MPAKQSRVHPRYKSKYRVANWPVYDRSLVECGSITYWLSADAIAGDLSPTRLTSEVQAYGPNYRSVSVGPATPR